jgi:ABC-type transporter Mla MlaB component
MRSIVIAVAVLFLVPLALGATKLSGSIDVPTTFTPEGSPYIIDDDVVVTLGERAVLTVTGGTTVTFGINSVLDASKGKLVVAGDVDTPAIFKGVNFTEGWQSASGTLKVGSAQFSQASIAGLDAVDGSAGIGKASFESVVFEYCRAALFGFTNAEVLDTGFFSNQYGVRRATGIKLSRCDFEDNEQTAVSGTGIALDFSHISGSKIAIRSFGASTSSPLLVTNCTLQENEVVFKAKEGKGASVTFCDLDQNTLVIQGHYEGLMQNNYWAAATLNDLSKLVQLDTTSTALIGLVSPFFKKPINGKAE